MRVAIVGGGLVGRLMAWHLCQSPMVVHLFDGTKQYATCAFASGAMLAPFTELAVLGNDWLDRALLALDWWPIIIKSLRGQIYYQQTGTELIANAEHEALLDHSLAAIKKVAPHASLQKRSQSYQRKSCHIDLEAHLNPRQVLMALGDYVRSQGIHWHHEAVQSIQANTLVASGKHWIFDCIVDCRGLGAQDRITDLRGVRGEIIILKADHIQLKHVVRFLHPHYSCYIIPQGESQYAIGATHLESEQSDPIYVKSAMSLMMGAQLVEPRFKDAHIVSTLVGIRPTVSSHVPYVKSEPGRYHLNGFFRHGFLLAPAIVAEVADRLKQGV